MNQALRATFIEGSQVTILAIFLSLNTGSEILSYYSFKIDGRQLISRNLVC